MLCCSLVLPHSRWQCEAMESRRRLQCLFGLCCPHPLCVIIITTITTLSHSISSRLSTNISRLTVERRLSSQFFSCFLKSSTVLVVSVLNWEDSFCLACLWCSLPLLPPQCCLITCFSAFFSLPGGRRAARAEGRIALFAFTPAALTPGFALHSFVFSDVLFHGSPPLFLLWFCRLSSIFCLSSFWLDCIIYIFFCTVTLVFLKEPSVVRSMHPSLCPWWDELLVFERQTSSPPSSVSSERDCSNKSIGSN